MNRLNERKLERLLRRIVREEEESFDLEKVLEPSGLGDEDIPEECKVNDPSMSKIDMIKGCITKITEKSTTLNNAIKTLSDSLSKAEQESSTVQTESRRRYNRRRF